MQSSYLFWKMLHIFGVTVFVGNIIVTAFWKLMADRSRDPVVMAFGQKLVNWTDFTFTSLGATLILISGLMMGNPYNNDFWSINWLSWGVGLFLASALVWGAVLFPLQVKQAWLARKFTAGQKIPEQYQRLGQWWFRVALLAIALALGNLYFMVMKPL